MVGLHDGRVKLAIAAPPVDGEANDAVLDFFADAMGVRRSACVLLSGQTGRRKRILIQGANLATLQAWLETVLRTNG